MKVYMINFLIFFTSEFFESFHSGCSHIYSLQLMLIHIIPRNGLFYYFREIKNDKQTATENEKKL